MFGLNLGRDNDYPDLGFPQSLLATAGIVPRSGHNGFLRNPFKFIIQVSRRPTLCSDGTEKAPLSNPERNEVLKCSSRWSNNYCALTG
jgi:hypothetical protein